MTDYKALAKEAMPQQVFPDPPHERDGGDDLGSKRQVDAQVEFTDAVSELLTREEIKTFDDYCENATVEEIIAEGLRLVALKTGQPVS